MVTDEEIEKLMKRAQAGCGGYHAMECAHEIMAEAYGMLGRLLIDRRRIMDALERLYEAQPFADSEEWAEIRNEAGKALAAVRG
jgi:hypothetical protein